MSSGAGRRSSMARTCATRSARPRSTRSALSRIVRSAPNASLPHCAECAKCPSPALCGVRQMPLSTNVERGSVCSCCSGRERQACRLSVRAPLPFLDQGARRFASARHGLCARRDRALVGGERVGVLEIRHGQVLCDERGSRAAASSALRSPHRTQFRAVREERRRRPQAPPVAADADLEGFEFTRSPLAAISRGSNSRNRR